MTRCLTLTFTLLLACGPGSQFTDAGPSSVGQPCAQASQCPGLSECRTQSSDGGQPYPGGYCTRTCFPSPTQEEYGCPADSACTPRGNLGEPSDSSGRCLRSCGSAADCRTGYSCRAIGAGGALVCAP